MNELEAEMEFFLKKQIKKVSVENKKKRETKNFKTKRTRNKGTKNVIIFRNRLSVVLSIRTDRRTDHSDKHIQTKC